MALARSNAPPAPIRDGGQRYRSPGLELVLDRLESDGRHEILDMGPAVEANISFFSQIPCRLHIEDLYYYLISQAVPPAEDENPTSHWAKLVTGSLVHNHEVRFDVILGWDLFSYMDPQLIRALMTKIGQRCNHGTLLFLMVSTEDAIPGIPAKVTISPDRQLVYTPVSESTIPNPRYTPLALERMMPRFQLLHSFLLGDGMQDYLFSFR